MSTPTDIDVARQVVDCNACFESLALERAGISLAQPFTVGKHYGPSGIALLGINPGASSDGAYKEARRLALTRFSNGDESALQDYWTSLATDAENFWNKKYLSRVRSLGLEIDQLLIGNLALCATAGNKYPNAMLRNCWALHVERVLRHYTPGVLILMGSESTTGEFLRRVEVALPAVKVIRIAHYAHREGNAYEASECDRVRRLLGSSNNVPGVRTATYVPPTQDRNPYQVNVYSSSVAADANPGHLEPVVTGPPTKYAGRYKLGDPPRSLVAHNLESWRVIEAILSAYGEADFWDLAVAVRGHRHGTSAAKGPQSFVRYCIRSGWLVRL